MHNLCVSASQESQKLVEDGIMLFIIFLGVTIMLIRSVMVVMGLYKEPIMRQLEHYGEERPYSPLLQLIVWSIILFALCIVILFNSNSAIMLFVLLSFPGLWLYWQIRDSVLSYPDIFLVYPRWYHQLNASTTREERRRLSYMWLDLPPRLRLLYNARDDAFYLWAELVMLSVA